ncbi:MAG: hypothetical protein ACFFE2_07860 [Candidatus Thorarchaeota archaeon]
MKQVETRQKRLRGVRVCRLTTMKNFVGGLLAVFIGSMVIVMFLGLTQPVYPEPFNIFWFLFAGSYAIQTTLLNPLTLISVGLYILTWIVMGLVIAPFSKPGWNTVRSALWVGLIHAVLALMSTLFTEPGFWESASRNYQLLTKFTTSLLLSILSLPAAIPAAIIVERVGREAEPPIPSKIETVCECGAVFKSKPMMCSECGRILNKPTE